jgi:uncharacterized protein YbbK (DUF523 family)
MPGAVVVSACLLGIPCRYDGGNKLSEHLIRMLADAAVIPVPVCPEQLAGFPTPRPPLCFAAGDGDAVCTGGGRVVNCNGVDVSGAMLAGAKAALTVARLAGARLAVFKERSPSCGIAEVYRGNGVVPGTGVTTALFRRQGIVVRDSRDLTSAMLADRVPLP